MVPSVSAFAKKWPRHAHDHRAQSAQVAAQVEHDAGALAHAGHGVLELRHHRRHEDVEADHPDAPGGTRQALGLEADVHGRQGAVFDDLPGRFPERDAELAARVRAVAHHEADGATGRPGQAAVEVERQPDEREAACARALPSRRAQGLHDAQRVDFLDDPPGTDA